MSVLRQLIAQMQLHLVQEYPANQWLMTDSNTYTFFKERALKKNKPAPAPAPILQTPPAVLPAQAISLPKPTPPPVSQKNLPSTPPPVATLPPEPMPKTKKSFELATPPPPVATDPDALKSLLAQVAPKLTLRDTPATKEDLAVAPQIVILCPAESPASHLTVLNNLSNAISRTWGACLVADPELPATKELLATPLKLVLAEGQLDTASPFLSIASIDALTRNPQDKIALWKELTARLNS